MFVSSINVDLSGLYLLQQPLSLCHFSLEYYTRYLENKSWKNKTVLLQGVLYASSQNSCLPGEESQDRADALVQGRSE